MSNHPNRGRIRGPASSPTPAQVKSARTEAGLTQTEAAALIYCTLSAWQRWEQDERAMHPAMWELFLLKANPPYTAPLLPASSKA